jgi:hypothetical protein
MAQPLLNPSPRNSRKHSTNGHAMELIQVTIAQGREEKTMRAAALALE